MLLYWPHPEDKFLYSCLEISQEQKDKFLALGWLELTEEEIIGLNNHTKCWNNNQVIDYIKTEEDLKIEQDGIKIARIIELKTLLTSSDYQAIKYAEGIISEEDYLPIKQQRQAWRDEINQLEAELE